MKKLTLAFFGTLALPVLAFAQSALNTNYIDSAVDNGLRYLGIAITVIMTLMTIWFLISVLNFIREKKPENIKERRRQMINGLIGLFISIAVWGIIKIAVRVTNVDTGPGGYAPTLTCPPGYRQFGGTCEPQ